MDTVGVLHCARWWASPWVRHGTFGIAGRPWVGRSAGRPAPSERNTNVTADAEQGQEKLQQSGLIYSGLVGIGVVLMQPFLTAEPVDLSAKICVLAFAVAIPVLAALITLNRQHAFRKRFAKSRIVAIAQVVGPVSAFVGTVAGSWHILWIAGVASLGFGILGVVVYTAGFASLTEHQN